MHICLCNPFNDKTVEDYLKKAADAGKRVKLAAVYKVCSGGRDPNCGTCCRTVLKEMVEAHNSRVESSDPSPIK